MNISMNSATTSTAADNASAAAAAVNAGADPALAGAALPQQAALTPFQQWLGLDTAGAPMDALPLVESSADTQGQDGQPDTAEAAEAADAAGMPGNMLLAAMAMPMMPAALPAMMMAMPGGARSGSQTVASAAPLPTDAHAASPLQAGDVPHAVANASASAAVNPAANAGNIPTAELPGGAPSTYGAASAAQAPPANAANAAPAAPAREGQAGAAVRDTVGTGAATEAATTFSVNAPAAPAAARTESTVSLAGPPAAWRQPLQEALGDRLNLQIGKQAEQAVIRLEPPMLGRIDISIRHVAGSLEVNISATHGEVLRQLNMVSDNLRSDLAQRQFSEVSVNVSQAPRAQAGQFGADPQGRGRQPDQEQQERTPGQALADLGESETARPYSPFTLNRRA